MDKGEPKTQPSRFLDGQNGLKDVAELYTICDCKSASTMAHGTDEINTNRNNSYFQKLTHELSCSCFTRLLRFTVVLIAAIQTFQLSYLPMLIFSKTA